jgi:hypothetical protein
VEQTFYSTANLIYTESRIVNKENKMTDTPTAIEVNCETGEVTERPLTAEEIADREAQAAAWEAEQAAKAAAEAEAAARKEAAHAKLAALGLTPEEIAAL